MSELPLIPTPPSQRFREFRVRFLPPLVFLATIAAIFLVWRDYVSPPALIGQVEPVSAEVTSRNSGVLTNLFVERFAEVQAGEVVAAVRVTDNRRYDSRLDVLRSQIALAQLELGTLADRQRLAIDYESLRSDYMRQQTDLQVARAQLPHAEFDVDLATRLLREKVVSEFEYHNFLSAYDSLKAKAEQLSNNVVSLERSLEEARGLTQGPGLTNGASTLLQRLGELQEEQRSLEALSATPLLLEAPISGVVTEVLRQPGENVLAGDPILVISSRQSERIIGYLRAPISVQPKIGMGVHIRARTIARVEAEARLSGVGASFQVITNVALLRGQNPAELGLPLAITIPTELRRLLVPGELIDISFKKE